MEKEKKPMDKKKSLIYFIVSVLAIAALCYVVAFGIGESKQGSAGNIVQGLDLQGGVSITFEVVDKEFTEEDFQDTYLKMEKRAYELSDEAVVYTEGDNRITVEIPGQDDAKAVLEQLGKPGSLQFVTDKGIKDKEKVWLEGDDVVNAKPYSVYDDIKKVYEYHVALTFSDEAAKVFEDVTEEYRGKILYIVYDGEAISSPYIQNKISGGEASISGMASYSEAEELAAMIRIGALKLDLKDISSKVVGAKLGEDAINTSLIAGIIGVALIIIFMIATYRVPGIAAGLALIAYVAMDLIAINAFDITLTLPGIAGVILSIGMAVDANVIIFVRIKEELGAGAEVHDAIKTGFGKATSAIVDGNITTLIAAGILWVMGSGPIQGFAKTLAFGIVISMATTLVVTRALLYFLYHIGFNKPNMYGVQKTRKTIDFIGKKAVLFGISAILIVGGIVAMFVRPTPFNLSVEFQGGVSTAVEFDKTYTITEFNEKILPKIQSITGDGDVMANDVSGTNQFVIRTKELDIATQQKIEEMLIKDFGALEGTFERTSVSASVSKEMLADAVWATAIAVVCMLLYIFIRFRDMRFATSAILALVHDIALVILFYSVSWTTVGNTFIACILTILGYSINATIVIFDRIREKLRDESYKGDCKQLVNEAITDTLTRSIYTSLTTFVTVAALYVLGVTAMKEFALPLMVGILAGAYSSVCVTGPLWYLMARKKHAAGGYLPKDDDED